MAEEKILNFNGIVVDDGGVEVPIRNKRGDEIGVFYFNPTDIASLTAITRWPLILRIS